LKDLAAQAQDAGTSEGRPGTCAFRVYGSGFMAQGLWLRVWCLGFMAFGVQVVGRRGACACRVCGVGCGSGFRVQGSGFRV
jgi:hypothetical protein